MSSVGVPLIWWGQIIKLAAVLCGGECLGQVLAAETVDCCIAVIVAERRRIVIGAVVTPTAGIVRCRDGHHTCYGICSLGTDQRQRYGKDGGEQRYLG